MITGEGSAGTSATDPGVPAAAAAVMMTVGGPSDRGRGCVMNVRLVCGSALLALAAVALAVPPPNPAADDQLLTTAHVGTDGPALLAYFRQRTVGDTDRQKIDALIRQL